MKLFHTFVIQIDLFQSDGSLGERNGEMKTQLSGNRVRKNLGIFNYIYQMCGGSLPLGDRILIIFSPSASFLFYPFATKYLCSLQMQISKPDLSPHP